MTCSNEIPQEDGYYWVKLQSTWKPQIIEYIGGMCTSLEVENVIVHTMMCIAGLIKLKIKLVHPVECR